MKNGWKKIKNITAGLKDLTTIGIAEIVGNTISAIFWLYIATILGAGDYGQISYFLAIAGIASGISLLGAENVLTVYIAKNIKIEPPVYFLTIIFGTLSSLVLFMTFQNLGASVLAFGSVIIGLGTSELLGRKLYVAYSKYLIIQRILMMGLAIGFYHLIGTNGVILGVALAFIPYVIRIYRGIIGSKIDFSLIRTHSSFIIHSYVLRLSGMFSGMADKIIIAPLLGYTILGNYQLAVQILNILQIFPFIVFKYTLPQDASGHTSKKLKKATVFISIGLSILVITIFPIIAPVLFPKFSHVIEAAQITSLSIIPASVSIMYMSEFLGNEKSKIVIMSSGIYVAVQITGIILLGKIFGINGIAFALLLAQSSQAVFLFSASRITRERTNKV